MKFLRKKLQNGMIVVMEKREQEVIALSITNRFGAAFEESKIKGIAHFIEHLLFTGTEKRTHEDISREVEKKGGILNAFTSHEVTSYWFKLPSEHVFAGLDILIDMLNNSVFEKEKFEKEKKVILEEIKMYHDSPQSYVFEMIEQNMFEKPFGDLVIGNSESVSKLDRDFVYNYWKENYSCENFIVTLVGNADFEKICNYLENSFKAKKKNLEIKKIKTKNSETIEEREGIDQAHFVFGIHAPFPDQEDYYALEVLDAYLANGMSSRLFLEIREKRGLAYSVNSSLNSEKNYSNYLIYVGTTKESVSKVKEIILDEFKKIEEMTEKDLSEAKERLIGLKRVRSEESSKVMNSLMFSELVDKAEDYYNYEKKIAEVKLKDVKRIAKIKEYSSATIIPK